MRELKFRAWKNLNGKMRRVVITPFSAINYGREHPDAAIFHANGVNDIRDFMPEADIVEQYTDLKDSNGKEIYEGDLIRVSDAPALKDKTLVVEFGEYYIGEYACTKMSGWLVRVVNGDWTASLLDEVGNCEVIGNVHENPELLEGGNNG